MTYKVEKVNPYDPGRPKQEQVTELFNEIAPVYDRMNGFSRWVSGVLAAGALRSLRPTGEGFGPVPARALVGCAPALAPRLSLPISPGMMEVGRKSTCQELEQVISFERQASKSMTFPDNVYAK